MKRRMNSAMPVILLMDETVGHLREGVELLDASEAAASDRLARDDAEQAEKPYAVLPGEYVPRLSPFGHGALYNITGLIHDDRGFPTSSKEAADRLCRRIMEKIAMNAGEIERYESRHMEDALTIFRSMSVIQDVSSVIRVYSGS